jgi:phosphomevalonate kinase
VNILVSFSAPSSLLALGYLYRKRRLKSLLTGLSNGLHSVTVYANDTYGNMGVSETVTFTISLPFPIVPVAAGSVAFAFASAAGLLVYFKKRKH